MKRSIVVILLTLVWLCACTPIPADDAQPLSLSYRGVELTVGMAAEQVIDALGDDYTMTEAGSCAGQGMDRMYRYPSVQLYVFAPLHGEARITSVSYTDDGVQSAQGGRIGCSAEDVIAAMGQADEVSDTRLIYRGEESVLTFGLRDGVVVSVVLSGE
jgi:hypothetical protein